VYQVHQTQFAHEAPLVRFPEASQDGQRKIIVTLGSDGASGCQNYKLPAKLAGGCA
jgi:hypothetical protein